MSTLGVVVFSLQGMKPLAQCLESVRWADSIVVLHVGEGEPAIEPGSLPYRVFRGLDAAQPVERIQQEIRTDWVLHLWGEERVGTELKEELQRLCQTTSPKASSGYRIPIRSRVLGRWVQGSLWGTSPSVRLLHEVRDLSLGWWDTECRNFKEVPGLVQAWIGDYSLAELDHGMDHVQSASDLWMSRLQAIGEAPSPGRIAKSSVHVFMRLMFMNGLFAGGLAGLTLSTLAAYATFLSGAKLWEKRNVKEKEVRSRVP